MKRPAAILLLTVALAGCTRGTGPGGDIPAAGPVCEAGPAARPLAIERGVGVLGATAQSIRRFGDFAYITESGSNTVSELDLESGELRTLVDVGNDRGPWEVWAYEDELWITNFVADTVTVADRETGDVLAEIRGPRLEKPAGIAGTDRYVYVGNTEYRGVNDYGPGSVSIIDREARELVATRPIGAPNPLHLDVASFSFGERVVVVASGEHRFDDGGGAVAGSDGAVELWEETSVPEAPDVTTIEVPRSGADDRVGLPGRPLRVDDRIYLVSAAAPVVFEVDAAAGRLVGEPTAFSDVAGDALHDATIDDRGVLWISSFNRDAIYRVDTRCGAVLGDPIPIGGGERLTGLVGSVERDGEVSFVMSFANELGRLVPVD